MSENSSFVRVAVDHDRCTGHGRCYSVAPEIFGRDDEDLAVVNVELVGPEQRALLDRAIKLCPELAIRAEPASSEDAS